MPLLHYHHSPKCQILELCRLFSFAFIIRVPWESDTYKRCWGPSQFSQEPLPTSTTTVPEGEADSLYSGVPLASEGFVSPSLEKDWIRGFLLGSLLIFWFYKTLTHCLLVTFLFFCRIKHRRWRWRKKQWTPQLFTNFRAVENVKSVTEQLCHSTWKRIPCFFS